MRHPGIILLHVLLAVVLLASLVVQLGPLPQYARASALDYPVLAWVETPCLVVTTLVIVCGQVILLAGWTLLILATRHRGSRPRTRLLVDVIIGALLVAAALCLGLGLWLQIAAGFDSLADGGLYVLAVCSTGCAVLVGVLRWQLRGAARPDRALAPTV